MILFRIVIPTLIHYSFHFVFTFLIVLLTLLFKTLGADKLTDRLLCFWAHGLFLSLGRRLHREGLEHIEHGKSYLVLINHSSLFDIPAVMSVLPEGDWIGREKLQKIPLFGRALKKTNYIPIDPANWRKSIQALEAAKEKSGKGAKILMFPEGTRTVNGVLGDFKRGFLHIARTTQIDILPITVYGLFCLKPRTRWFVNTAEKTGIVVHPPLHCSKLKELSDDEVLLQVRQSIESGFRKR